MKKNKFNTDKKSPSLGGVGEDYRVAPKILVIQQKMIGDVLTSSLICENLKLNFPDARIHYLVNRFTLPVVESNPCIDELIIFEKEHRTSKIKFYKFLKFIAKQNYTHVFDAYAKLESLLITRFSKAKYRYGFKKSYSKFYYTKTVEIKKSSNTEVGTAIENRLQLLNLMPNINILRKKPKVYLEKSELMKAKIKLENAGIAPKNCMMISALGSDKSKTYPLEYLAELLDDIASRSNLKMILNYMPSQMREIEELINLCDSKTQNQFAMNVEMRGLRDFMWVCKQCKAIIGNEGGAINIAKALDVPSFSIFSPWIIKEGWNSFEINHPNMSVHLSDYKKDLFIDNEVKFIKKNVDDFYTRLKPDLIKEKLFKFLDSYVN
jgi:heptosyltransferase-2